MAEKARLALPCMFQDRQLSLLVAPWRAYPLKTWAQEATRTGAAGCGAVDSCFPAHSLAPPVFRSFEAGGFFRGPIYVNADKTMYDALFKRKQLFDNFFGASQTPGRAYTARVCLMPLRSPSALQASLKSPRM